MYRTYNSRKHTNKVYKKGMVDMRILEKELTPDQISDVEKLGQLKQKLSPEKWVLFRTLMLTYLSGIEAGISLEMDAQAQTTI